MVCWSCNSYFKLQNPPAFCMQLEEIFAHFFFCQVNLWKPGWTLTLRSICVLLSDNYLCSLHEASVCSALDVRSILWQACICLLGKRSVVCNVLQQDCGHRVGEWVLRVLLGTRGWQSTEDGSGVEWKMRWAAYYVPMPEMDLILDRFSKMNATETEIGFQRCFCWFGYLVLMH